MWNDPQGQKLPWYYFPDGFVSARLKPEHIILGIFGTHFRNKLVRLICSYLGNHNNVIVEFGSIHESD